MKNRRIAARLALALAAAAALCAPAASAQAAPRPPQPGGPLPRVTFRIQDSHGQCVDTSPDASNDHLVFLEPCNLLNLEQQFLYNPVTKQISSLAQPGRCLDDGTLQSVYDDVCDTKRYSQQFTAVNVRGRYRLVSTFNNRQRQPIYLLSEDGVSLRGSTNFQNIPANDFLFTLPLA